MQNGPFIAKRLLPGIVAAYAQRSSVEYQAFSDSWVLRLSVRDRTKWVVGYKFDLNSSGASELAQDKVATYAALSAASVRAVPHYLVRPHLKEEVQVAELKDILHASSVVVKPLEGTGGRDVEWYSNLDEALEMISERSEPAWAVSPYLEVESEHRYIMLDQEPLLAFEKTNPTLRGKLKLFNLGFGAIAQDVQADAIPEYLSLAKEVMSVMSLRVAAVDIIRLTDGSYSVLEVNDGILMEHYARQSNDHLKRASDSYERILATMLVG